VAIFSDTFSEDSDFWWKLALEEKDHADRIRTYMSDKGIETHS